MAFVLKLAQVEEWPKLSEALAHAEMDATVYNAFSTLLGPRPQKHDGFVSGRSRFPGLEVIGFAFEDVVTDHMFVLHGSTGGASLDVHR